MIDNRANKNTPPTLLDVGCGAVVLEEADAKAITNTLGKGCAQKTKEALYRVLFFGPHTIDIDAGYELLQRVAYITRPNGACWDYVPFACHWTERKRLRKLLIG